MKHEGTFKIVRLLQPGTILSAINDADDDVQGMVESYHFAEYTRADGGTSHDVEYLVKWSDGLYEWISWSEANEYSPVRPPRKSPYANVTPRGLVNA